jgi:metallo-beta-lactamase family protein
MESTYGDRNHENQQGIDEQLSRIVSDTVNAGGNLLIPTFAIERAQDILYHFNRLAQAKKIPYVMTFLDSPMAVKITEVFERSMKYFDKETQELFKGGQSPFEFPSLMFVESVEASKAINLIKGSTVIMAGSGMISGGRIEHHLAMNITRPESTLLFVGYQAAGTLGHQISNCVSNVKIYGQDYHVCMKIEKIDAFSAHAGMIDLQRWLNSFKSPPRRIFLTHGEEGPILSLEKFIQSKDGWVVSAPTYLEEYDL